MVEQRVTMVDVKVLKAERDELADLRKQIVALKTQLDETISDKHAQVTNACRDAEDLRKQRDFLLESNNRLVEERRAADAKADRWLAMLEKCQDQRSALLVRIADIASATEVAR